MKKIDIGKKENIHLIGIGGIGMSGLAKIMKTIGLKVQGSDLKKNKNIDECKKLGIKIFIGHSSSNIKKATLIVKSSAVNNSNKEIKEAKRRKLPIFKRAEMLANIISLKKNIIITGSHGKTTTTSLVSKILSESKLDPTIINGGVINSLKSNAKFGKGDWTVIEADESDGSFLKLPINYSIVTNLDHEHLDYYKTFKNLETAFIKFLNKTPPIGKAIVCIDNVNIKKILKKTTTKNLLTYGSSNKSDYQIINVKYLQNKMQFDLIVKNYNRKKKIFRNIIVNLIGYHNVQNATAAISICLNLGIKINIIKRALNNFTGVQRRMTKIFTYNSNEFFDDYAHHPTEISAVLDGVNKLSNKKKIISIFQPHRYSRIKSLKTDFSRSFVKSNLVILCPVYSAGEKNDSTYNQILFSKLIAKNSNVQVINVKSEKDLSNYLTKNLLFNNTIIGMGAGSISEWMRNLKKEFI